MKLKAGEVVVGREPHIVSRPRLTDLLDATTARIVLLLAPAGYGKTTLARQWLAERPQAWYRGSAASADVAALALGLARTAGKIAPHADERLATRLRFSDSSALDVAGLAALLADDLGEWPADAWLVFDDYHFACDSEPAEQFVEVLATASRLRLLITSRTRPRWASARRLLYGEVFELGRNLLSMRQDEARSVLRSRGEESEALVALADGWPALLGLGTLASHPEVLQDRPSDELYDFFAHELYQGLPAADRRALRLLSLTSVVTPERARLLVGDEADRVLKEAVDRGFLSTHSKPLEFHPLLRSFLVSKFNPREDDPEGAVVSRLVQLLLDEREWDQAFELIDRFFAAESLVQLLEASLPRMVDEARLPTLQHWIRVANAHRVESAVLDLAEAELELADGKWRRAESLALQAERRLPPEHVFRSKALWIAGLSAHMTFQPSEARLYFASAAEAARSPEDERQGRWGQFLTNIKLEDGHEAARLLDVYARKAGRAVDEQLRVSTGRMNLAVLTAEVDEALGDAARVAALATRGRDPLIQSAFLHAYGVLLALNGRYDEALETAQSSFAALTAYRLRFPIGYSQLVIGVAQLGLRGFRRSGTALRLAENAAGETGDAFLQMNVVVTRARLQLASGSVSGALDVLERHQHLSSIPSMRGEYLAWWSLAAALANEPKQAQALSARAEALTRRIDVVGLTPWTPAVLAVQSGRPAEAEIEAAWSGLHTTGNVDAFVTAYRSCPDLLTAVKNRDGGGDRLRTILERARDHRLAEGVGLPLPVSATASGPSALTNREREVLELVCQGLMNKEIARTLFITEATAKVHVRKICQKLGVRSRTEAAIRASELSG